MRNLFLFCFVALLAFSVHAQDVITHADPLKNRRALAEQMVALRPINIQIDNAIDGYIKTEMDKAPAQNQEAFRTSMKHTLNEKAITQMIVDAYTETFTEAELSTMVAYYSAPETPSIAEKQKGFGDKIRAGITKMLDQAAMRARTEGKN